MRGAARARRVGLVEAIDQADFRLNHRAGVAVALMVGFLVFAVALDLTWAEPRRVLRSPAAPGVGLFAQFVSLARARLWDRHVRGGDTERERRRALAAPGSAFHVPRTKKEKRDAWPVLL